MIKKFKVKSGDVVRVIAGADKGKEGEITNVIVKKDRLIVKGINMVSKHVKPNAKNPKGGIVKMEAPIHISNVMLVENGQTIKVGYRFNEQNKKVRFSKKTNKEL